jgi:hypothetical protein
MKLTLQSKAGGIGAVLALLIGSSLMRNAHEDKFRIVRQLTYAATLKHKG